MDGTGTTSRVSAAKWLRQARHDLLIAERTIGIEGYAHACFLAQQAVEKLLKALLIAATGRAPFTHDLLILGSDLDLPGDIVESLRDIAADYAVARYPDLTPGAPFEQYDAQIAGERVDAARRIFERLAERAAPIGGDPA